MPFNNKKESQSKKSNLISQIKSLIVPGLSGQDVALEGLYCSLKESSPENSSKLLITRQYSKYFLMEYKHFPLFFGLLSKEAKEELELLELKSETKLKILAICSLAYLKHKSSFSRIIFKTFCYIACFAIMLFFLYLKNTNWNQFIANIVQDKFFLAAFSAFAVFSLLILILQSISICRSKNQLKVLGATESPLVELSKTIESDDKKSSIDVIIRKLYPHQSYWSILLDSVVFAAFLSTIIGGYATSIQFDLFYIIWTFVASAILIASVIWKLYSSCNQKEETEIVKQTINHINELSNALKAHEQKESEEHTKKDSSHSEDPHAEASGADSEQVSAHVEGSEIDASKQQTRVVEHPQIDIADSSAKLCLIQ